MQNKQKNLLFVVLGLLILTVITMGIFSFINKNKQNNQSGNVSNIVETKTFSEIPGFSFEYPVFKGWEVDKVKKDSESEYSIFFKNPLLTGVAPSMRIVKTKAFVTLNKELKENLNRIKYAYDKEKNLLTFYITTAAFYVDIYPFGYEGDGYSGNVLADKIIDSFKLSPSPKDDATIVPNKPAGQISDVIKQICKDKKTNTIGAWKDNQGSIKYLQIPLDTRKGNDMVVYLYDFSGNVIVKMGGLAPNVENQMKYRELTKDLVMSELKCR